jgi:hypothetical protein
MGYFLDLYLSLAVDRITVYAEQVIENISETNQIIISVVQVLLERSVIILYENNDPDLVLEIEVLIVLASPIEQAIFPKEYVTSFLIEQHIYLPTIDDYVRYESHMTSKHSMIVEYGSVLHLYDCQIVKQRKQYFQKEE